MHSVEESLRGVLPSRSTIDPRRRENATHETRPFYSAVLPPAMALRRSWESRTGKPARVHLALTSRAKALIC